MTSPPGHAGVALPPEHPMVHAGMAQASLIQSFRGYRTSPLPVWFMRQAGRSLPEYRAARSGTGMLEACLNPELACELTLQPVRRHGVDAAIYFSDIVVPLRLAGIDVQIVPGTGPVIAHPIRATRDVANLPELDQRCLDPIRRAVGLIVRELGGTPLIGFAGAPFTLASYLIEGGPSRDHERTLSLMNTDPETWHRLLDWVAGITGEFLKAQGESGASALQLFDSWAGALTLDQYQRFVAAHSAKALGLVADMGLPRVHFGTHTGHLLTAMRDVGADVMGIDADTPLDVANATLGGTTPLQGNIDPKLLDAPWEALAAHVEDVLTRGRAAPGHVVNLGHGVPPHTDPDVLTRVADLVHELTSDGGQR